MSVLAAWGCNLLTSVGDLELGGPAGGPDASIPIVDGASPRPPPDASRPDIGFPFPDGALPDVIFVPEDAAAGDAGPRDGSFSSLRVFVTSTTTNGLFGGLSKGDDLCAARAAAAGLGGQWRAWLSAGQVAAFTRITADGPWVNTQGQLVAASRLALASGNLANEIRFDENGQSPQGTSHAFTGTRADGTPSTLDCGGWTLAGGLGAGATLGHLLRTGSSWTADTTQACTNQRRLYCFENAL